MGLEIAFAAATTIGARLGANSFFTNPVFAYLNPSSYLSTYLYQEFTYPALFAPASLEGPKLHGLQFQQVDEGLPINIAFGSEAKLSGQVIYESDLIERQNSHSQNGKGGTGGEYVEYTYSMHVAIALCEGEISRVLKIWANGKVIYDVGSTIQYSSNLVAGVVGQVSYLIYQGPITGWVSQIKYYLKITSPSNGPDLSIYRLGQKLTINNAPSTDNGSWNVIEAVLNNDGTSHVKVERYQVQGFAPFAAWTAGTQTPTLTQVVSTFSQKNMDSLTFYTGSNTQGVDPLLEALEGTGNVPAFRGTAYVVIKNLQLVDFGNVLPQLEFLVEVNPAETVGTACAGILRRAGYSDDEYDVASLTEPVLGYVVRGMQPAASALQPLFIAYELVSWEDAGVLRILKRKNAPVVDIDPALLAAGPPGTDRPRTIQDTSIDETVLPSQVTVTYFDPLRDWQKSTQHDIRRTAGNEIQRGIDLPMSFAAADARALANHSVWGAPVIERKMATSIPPSLVGIVHEAMIMHFTADGKERNLFVERVDRGAEWTLAVEGFNEQKQIFDVSPEPESPPVEENDGGDLGLNTQHRSLAPQPLIFHILDCAALQDDHQYSPGFYVACALTSTEERFTGGAFYESVDGGIDYRLVSYIQEEAVLGATNTELGGGVIPELWDLANTVDVELTNGTLESVDQDTCLNGKNRLMIGREIIGFTTATLIDVNTWRLSGFLRGLRDTAPEIENHAVGDRVVLLDGPGLYFHKLNLSSVGMQRHYKVVSNAQNLVDALEQEHWPVGENVKPFTPCEGLVTLDASNNYRVTWVRCTRSIVRLLTEQSISLLEPWEKYEIDVWSTGKSELIRTVTVESPEFFYTSDEQTADGETPGADYEFHVSQVSDLVRRGHTLVLTT